MLGRCAAASADKLDAGIDQPLGVLGHVLGRAHVHLPALDITRHAGVRLSRELARRMLSHLLDCLEDDLWSDRTIEPDDVSSPLIEPGREDLREGPKGCCALLAD